MRKNIIIFLIFLIFSVFYIRHDNSSFVSADIIPPWFVFIDTYEEFGCQWGNDYGDDIGKRITTRYCAEKGGGVDLDDCIETGIWTSYEDCNDCQYCNEENGEYSCIQDESPLFPRNGQFQIATRPVTLDWCSIDDATSYEIKIWKWEVDGDGVWTEELEDELESTESTVCAKSLKDKDDTYYKWQIAPCYGESCDPFGAKWKFDTGEEQSIEVPDLTLPSSNNFDLSIPVTFNWTEIENAKSYYILIVNQDEELVVFESTTSNSVTFGVESLINSSYYAWSVAACLGDDGNACGSDCCFNERGDTCADVASPLFFATNNTATFNDVELVNPYNEAPSVKPFDLFEWQSLGATGFVFNVKNKAGNLIAEIHTPDTTMDLSNIVWQDNEEEWTEATGNGKLAFNTEYVWQVTPCWWDSGNDKAVYCKIANSNKQSFTTSGGQITSIISPASGSTQSIPTIFNWEEVPNAFSYHFQLKDEGGNIVDDSIIRTNRISLDYPIVEPNTNYSWGIKACADEDGSYCENNWHNKSFTVEELQTPSSEQLEDWEVSTYENNLVWQPVSSAKSYEYTIQYNAVGEEEINDNCEAGTLIRENAISNSNYILMPNFPGTQQKCLGEYTFWVTACVTENCEGQTSDNSITTEWTFDYIQSGSSGEGGMMPCGKDNDIYDTPWNERENCQLKHVPIFIYNVIDFILWKASLIALLVLIVFSGIIAYASAGLPVKVVSIKEVWKNAGKGYVVMFFAWTIISIALKLLGITESFLMLPPLL